MPVGAEFAGFNLGHALPSILDRLAKHPGQRVPHQGLLRE
jgi:hypothetical protein